MKRALLSGQHSLIQSAIRREADPGRAIRVAASEMTPDEVALATKHLADYNAAHKRRASQEMASLVRHLRRNGINIKP